MAYRRAAAVKSGVFRRWFLICPVRHVLIIISATVTAAYFTLRGNFELMTWLYSNVVRRWHNMVASFCDVFPFSVAGLLIAAGVIILLAYTGHMLVKIITRDGRLLNTYKLVAFIAAAFLTVYAGFCVLWGIYYYTSDFEAMSGLEAGPVSTDELEVVTKYFAKLASEYGAEVARDENGLFAGDIDAAFDASTTLYENIEKTFPFLKGAELRAKPFMFSRIMSYIGFTGFFFPFTR